MSKSFRTFAGLTALAFGVPLDVGIGVGPDWLAAH